MADGMRDVDLQRYGRFVVGRRAWSGTLHLVIIVAAV
jgi:hypothetical protein